MRLEVLELLGEELVALLQRGELLQRERVDLAELRQLALGRAQPLLLRRPVERRRLAAPARSALLAASSGRRRHRLVAGRSSASRSAPSMPYSSSRLGLQLLDPQPLLGARTSSRCTGVGQPCRARP